MATHETIVIGASAGGVQALKNLLENLPEDLPSAVFIVLHVSPDSPGLLPTILGRESPLPVAHGIDGEPITVGRVYVAPPDLHLLLEKTGCDSYMVRKKTCIDRQSIPCSVPPHVGRARVPLELY